MAPEAKIAKRAESSTPGARRGGTPFRYIDESQVFEKDPRLKSNSYEDKVKFSPGESWGLKAARELASVSGDRWNHEKTKKKRGSYRGGPISMTVHSIQLASSESD
jgi:hypothetical protein